jgi:hypothetical protein
MVPMSFAWEFAKVRATNATDTSFASRVATTTTPADDGVVSIADVGSTAPTWVCLVPYGSGGDGDTFDVRVVGWRKVSTLWVPTILLQFTATMSTAVGVASAAVTNSERFADTVGDPATGMGSVGVNCQPTSPANNTPAHYLVDTRGCAKFEVLFDATAAGTTGMNCLWARV